MIRFITGIISVLVLTNTVLALHPFFEPVNSDARTLTAEEAEIPDNIFITPELAKKVAIIYAGSDTHWRDNELSNFSIIINPRIVMPGSLPKKRIGFYEIIFIANNDFKGAQYEGFLIPDIDVSARGSIGIPDLKGEWIEGERGKIDYTNFGYEGFVTEISDAYGFHVQREVFSVYVPFRKDYIDYFYSGQPTLSNRVLADIIAGTYYRDDDFSLSSIYKSKGNLVWFVYKSNNDPDIAIGRALGWDDCILPIDAFEEEFLGFPAIGNNEYYVTPNEVPWLELDSYPEEELFENADEIKDRFFNALIGLHKNDGTLGIPPPSYELDGWVPDLGYNSFDPDHYKCATTAAANVMGCYAAGGDDRAGDSYAEVGVEFDSGISGSWPYRDNEWDEEYFLDDIRQKMYQCGINETTSLSIVAAAINNFDWQYVRDWHNHEIEDYYYDPFQQQWGEGGDVPDYPVPDHYWDPLAYSNFDAIKGYMYAYPGRPAYIVAFVGTNGAWVNPAHAMCAYGYMWNDAVYCRVGDSGIYPRDWFFDLDDPSTFPINQSSGPFYYMCTEWLFFTAADDGGKPDRIPFTARLSGDPRKGKVRLEIVENNYFKDGVKMSLYEGIGDDTSPISQSPLELERKNKEISIIGIDKDKNYGNDYSLIIEAPDGNYVFRLFKKEGWCKCIDYYE